MGFSLLEIPLPLCAVSLRIHDAVFLLQDQVSQKPRTQASDQAPGTRLPVSLSQDLALFYSAYADSTPVLVCACPLEQLCLFHKFSSDTADTTMQEGFSLVVIFPKWWFWQYWRMYKMPMKFQFQINEDPLFSISMLHILHV